MNKLFLRTASRAEIFTHNIPVFSNTENTVMLCRSRRMDEDVRRGIITMVAASEAIKWYARMIMASMVRGQTWRTVDNQGLNKWYRWEKHLTGTPFDMVSITHRQLYVCSGCVLVVPRGGACKGEQTSDNFHNSLLEVHIPSNPYGGLCSTQQLHQKI